MAGDVRAAGCSVSGQRSQRIRLADFAAGEWIFETGVAGVLAGGEVSPAGADCATGRKPVGMLNFRSFERVQGLSPQLLQ